MSSGASAAHSLMSAPTQNAFSPSAVSTTTRTVWSSSSSRAQRSSSSSIGGVNEFSLAGRASVTVATKPSRSRRTSASAMATLLAGQLQPERLGAEQRRVHDAQIGAGAQGYLGVREHVALQIDAGRDLAHHQGVVLQADHATFGHIRHLLPAFARDAAAERDVLGGIDELAGAAFPDDLEPSIADLQFGTRGKKARKHDAPCMRCDVDEAAAARGEIGLGAELRDVDAACTVDLHE